MSSPHFALPKTERDRADRLRNRLAAANRSEVVRRALITLEQLLQHQEAGGDIILCKKGVADKCLWFV